MTAAFSLRRLYVQHFIFRVEHHGSLVRSQESKKTFVATLRIPRSLYLPIKLENPSHTAEYLLIPRSLGSRVLGNSFRNAEHSPTLQQSDTRPASNVYKCAVVRVRARK